MKKRCCRYFVVLGLACAFLAASVTVTGNVEAGYLTINRFPALGGGITAFVTIDGEPAGRIRWGEHYHRSLAPGDHFISIMVYPNHMVLAPAEKRVSVQRGQSYMFTLRWNGDRLVLM